VFRQLPAGNAIEYIVAALEPSSSVLDLGCGAGRLLLGLAAAGFVTTGVDICPEMLAQIPSAETVCADIVGLDLGRTFDAVVLASYLVNDVSHASSFLETARRHVVDGGIVIVQRYDPLWLSDAVEDETTTGNVAVAVHHFVSTPPLVAFTVTYKLGSDSWDQHVEAHAVDDTSLSALCADVGLAFDRWLDDYRTWARLIAV
jgi:SAM-dependent methyltransferase